MRSAPSALRTRWSRRRHRKRKGGSSGTIHHASTGSGGSNSRTGRGGFAPPSALREREGLGVQRWEGEGGGNRAFADRPPSPRPLAGGGRERLFEALQPI